MIYVNLDIYFAAWEIIEEAGNLGDALLKSAIGFSPAGKVISAKNSELPEGCCTVKKVGEFLSDIAKRYDFDLEAAHVAMANHLESLNNVQFSQGEIAKCRISRETVPQWRDPVKLFRDNNPPLIVSVLDEQAFEYTAFAAEGCSARIWETTDRRYAIQKKTSMRGYTSYQAIIVEPKDRNPWRILEEELGM